LFKRIDPRPTWLLAIVPAFALALALPVARAEPPTLAFNPAPGTISFNGTAPSTITVQPVAPAICEAPIGPEDEATLTCLQDGGAGNFAPASVARLFTCDAVQARWRLPAFPAR
jgi:hypothetical protein